MSSHARPSEIALYLSDVEEEFSPTRLEAYTSEVLDYLPQSACADLQAAFEKLAEAQANIRKAVSRLHYVSRFDGFRL